MANGDSKYHRRIRGTVQTTDATPQVVAQYSIPTSPEGIVAIRGWAQGVRTDGVKSYMQHRQGSGIVNASSFSLLGEGAVGSAVDVGTSGYALAIDSNAGFVRLLATGAGGATVTWQGELEVIITEQTIT